jgi:hypothetical protein
VLHLFILVGSLVFDRVLGALARSLDGLHHAVALVLLVVLVPDPFALFVLLLGFRYAFHGGLL